MKPSNDVYYSDYLQLDKILNAQESESRKYGPEAHDEHLFIITHQAYELWFKQVLYELEAIRSIFEQNTIDDNSRELYQGFHLLNRVNTILRVLIHQIDIMETMTSMDFLDFRNYLRPASGFQSIQFKLVEAILGLREDDRYKKEYYLSQLRKEDIGRVKEVEEKQSILVLLKAWLDRMPFLEEERYWKSYVARFAEKQLDVHPFWNDYYQLYEKSLHANERFNLEYLEKVLTDDQHGNRLQARTRRHALFIILYRDFPLLQLPFQFLQALLETDELLSTWRFRHMNMVNRVIGNRTGTGGSSGKDYLQRAMNRHYIFGEFAELATCLMERRFLPELPKELQARLSYPGQ